MMFACYQVEKKGCVQTGGFFVEVKADDSDRHMFSQSNL